MNLKHVLALSILLAASPLLASEWWVAKESWVASGSCDRVDAFVVGGSGESESRTIVFVWDTAKGRVQRLGATGLTQIPVESPSLFFWPRSSHAGTSLPKVEQWRLSTRQRLETTVLSEVDFRETNIRDALRFLQKACNVGFPDADHIKIVWRDDPVSAEESPSVGSEDTGIAERSEPTPMLHFRVEDASVAAVLEILRAHAGLQSTIRPGGIVRVDYDYWGGGKEPIHTAYRLNGFARDTLARMGGDTPKAADANLRRLLVDLGASPNEIRRIDLAMRAGFLMVVATPSVHRRLQGLLSAISEGESEPGRFRMHAVTDRSGDRTVLLLDVEEGHAWRYHIGRATAGDHATEERFELVPEAEEEPR